MTAGPDQPHLGVFDPAPRSEWDEDVDDDVGDVIPPAAVDMEILVPIERPAGYVGD